jgi:predicted O-methyltransferase YrrM
LKTTGDFGRRRQLLWRAVRRFVPRKTRWFIEGHPKLHGQLWFEDRKLLYDTVRAYRPVYCFEIGTWKGGGSTLFILQALYENGKGKLYTIEVEQTFYEEATSNYRTYLPHLLPYVEFYLGEYRTTYPKVLSLIGTADLLLLDGAEDAQQTLDQYQLFLPYLGKGSMVLVHDWHTEKAESVRPLLLNGDEWEIIKILDPPRSLGFALTMRK